MEFENPKYHQQIVEDLMNGKFILSKEIHFEDVKENRDFYEKFFRHSFGYEFIFKPDYAYIISSETNENLSRDICIFIAILCYELDKAGINFLDKIEFGDFSLEEIDKYFENSSFVDLIKGNNSIKDYDSRRKLIRTMTTKNITEKNSEDRFSFTPVYKVFIDFAKELAESSKESETINQGE
ncbi:MAG TPA: hypothetical protein PK784_05555 [Tenuifilaceae bacterium]|nr:hypothetical protein [Tenuifilaceae bacterium]HPN22073.1 hypothetical protein [Tenuifilaceae bacterium]